MSVHFQTTFGEVDDPEAAAGVDSGCLRSILGGCAAPTHRGSKHPRFVLFYKKAQS